MPPKVRGSGLALEFAAPALRGDAEVALAATRQSPAAFAFVPQELWSNHDFALPAVRHQLDQGEGQVRKPLDAALDHVPGELWADRLFVLGLVSTHSWMLTRAAPQLLADAEVVLAACRQDKDAAFLGAPELWRNGSFVLEAHKLYGVDSFAHAAPELWTSELHT